MADDLYDYLEARGIDPQIIARMRNDKIDALVILMMDDESLSEFIPLFGDRIALRHFCEALSPDKQAKSPSKKDKLLERLRHKLGLKRNGGKAKSADVGEWSGYSRSVKLMGNENAKKNERKIDVGWLDYDCVSDKFKQVRKHHGGGTRSLSVSKVTVVTELLEIAKELFFKDGKSFKGSLEQFEYCLCDFRQQPLSDEVNIGQLYDESKMPVLRFYLQTKAKESTEQQKVGKRRKVLEQDDLSTEDENSGLPLVDTGKEDPQDEVIQLSSSVEDLEEYLELPDITLDISQVLHNSGSNEDEMNLSLSQNDLGNHPDSPTIRFGQTNAPSNDEQLNDTIPSAESYHVLLLRRGVLVEDMINAFSDESICHSKIAVHMVLPNGDVEAGQGSGVYRDALTQFWEEFYQQMTTGDIYKVPVIRHDYSEKEWEAVGSIITKGWQDEGYFPISLAPPFMEVALYGISEMDMKRAFLSYVTESEREVLEKALHEFPSDPDEVVDILAGYDCKKLLKKENLSRILYELGHKEMIQKPMFVADCMRKVLHPLQGSFSKEQFMAMYEDLRQSSKKIIEILRFPQSCSASEHIVTTYLKRYVRSLSDSMLKKFLRFCTGSDVVSMTTINVVFNSLEGFQRRPVGHTCTNTLEIPASYESFLDLRQEFSAVLESGVWIMDFV